ncbi:MAG: AraC family transcriptional regulator [Clostridia bacterium]|nr:AraC family transcriptional regulator [Clostridia bacterium]
MQKIYVFNYGFKDMNPLSLGQEACRADKCYTAIRDITQIHYIRSGKGILEKNGKKYPAQAGDCVLTLPGEKYKLYSDPVDPWSYIWIGFGGEKSEHFSRLKPVFHYEGDLFYKMIDTAKITYMREYSLSALLLELYRELFSSEKLTPEQVALQARAYIEANYMNECKMEDIAKTLGYSRSHLSKLYKKVTGGPLKWTLIYVRMQAAYDYISAGMTTAEAAQLCGYPDASTFSRAFKAHFKFSVRDLQTKKRYMWDTFDPKTGKYI